MRFNYRVGTIAALAGAMLAFTACSSSGGGGGGGTSAAASGGGGGASSAAKAASGSPIQLGMINQENTAAGSFPDVRQGALAAASYINNSLGGLKGHPLKISPCITDASPASGANCSRKLIGEHVVAVIGGEDFSTSGSIPPLAAAKVPYVGGIPILPAESTSPISFQFSGGSAAAFSAQNLYLVKYLHVKSVNIITTANPAGLAAATTFGADILKKLGVTNVKTVQAAADAADFTAPVQQIAANNPDAIMVLFGSPACSRIMQAIGSLGVKSTTFYPGSCLTQKEVTAGGNGADGAYFNSDNMLFDGNDPQVVTWRDQMKKYQPSATLSAYSQNGFQSVMNLWESMKKISGTPTPATIIANLRASVNVPSFMGHPYTCNGKVIPSQPAICSAGQRIIQYKGGKFTDVLNKWIDGAYLAG